MFIRYGLRNTLSSLQQAHHLTTNTTRLSPLLSSSHIPRRVHSTQQEGGEDTPAGEHTSPTYSSAIDADRDDFYFMNQIPNPKGEVDVGGYRAPKNHASPNWRPKRMPFESEMRQEREPKDYIVPLHWPDIVKGLSDKGEEHKIPGMRKIWDKIVVEGQIHFRNSRETKRNVWQWGFAEREVTPGPQLREFPVDVVSNLLDDPMPKRIEVQRDFSEVFPEPPSYEQQKMRIFKAPILPFKKESMVSESGNARGGGTRKRATADAMLSAGSGTITINGRHFVDYFDMLFMREIVLEPLVVGQQLGVHDIKAKVSGGGKKCQAEALKLAIANCLAHLFPPMREQLKKKKLLTYDSRRVERKKPGQKKARKKFQWSKR